MQSAGKIFMRITLMFFSILTFFLPSFVEAEQPAAEEYRKIFKSGNFYVEYKDKWGTRILARKNKVAMERMRYDFESGSLQYLNPLGAIFGGGEAKNPEVMYRNGKYYQFAEKNKASVCSEKDLDNPALDPRQGWNKVIQKLALPDELAVFYPEDPYRRKTLSISAPSLLQSLQKNFKGKSYDCDRYTCKVKNAGGTDAANLIYDVLYTDGKIFCIESFIAGNGTMYPLNILEVKKIAADIPDGVFKIEKNTKLYSAGFGDMDDLLERPKQIGVINE